LIKSLLESLPLDDKFMKVLTKIEALAAWQTWWLRVQHLGKHLKVGVATLVG